MKTLQILTLLLLVGAPVKPDIAQAAVSGSVVAWGWNRDGQTNVPLEALSEVTAISAGLSHTVALKSDGSVVAWGDNTYGQTDVPTSALEGVAAIAAGGNHTVALKADGSVVAWGYNDYGQTTVPVTAQSGVVAIAAGDEHTVALRNDGSVVAWGRNILGQTTVPAMAKSNIVAVAAGGDDTLALKTDGSVIAWGWKDWGQTSVPDSAKSGVTAIAAGERHSLALKNDGSVMAWGDNSYHQVAVPDAAKAGVIAVAAGDLHNVALKSDGTVVVWGRNDYGETTVPAEAQSGVTAIAAGASQTVVLVTSSTPKIVAAPVSLTVSAGQSASFTVLATGGFLGYQWRREGVPIVGATGSTFSLGLARAIQTGSYDVVTSNHLGSVTNAPSVSLFVKPADTGQVVAWGNWADVVQVPIAALAGVVGIAAGGQHSVALKTDQSVVAWGHNGSGQVTGLPTFENPSVATENPVSPGGQIIGGVTAIAAGGNHTVALKADGSVVAWGDNGAGQVTGVPTTAYPPSAIAIPVALEGRPLSSVVAIAAGSYHTVALTAGGAVVAWGSDSFGQTSVPDAAKNGVAAIAAAGNHTVALRIDGAVLAWGDNLYGQSNVPDEARSGIVAIATGGNHVVALKANGAVVAWGNRAFGQTTIPTSAQGNVSAVAAGEYHTAMLRSDGSMTVMGDSRNGQATVPYAARNNVIAITAGNYFTMAIVNTTGPALKFGSGPSGAFVSWPLDAIGYAVQFTDSLEIGSWSTASGVSIQVDGMNILPVKTIDAIEFYRLFKFDSGGGD